MTTKTLVVAALAVLAFHPSAAFARDPVPPEFAGRGCEFYANENGQGSSAKINVNARQAGGGERYEIIAQTMSSFWNDNISAVKCDSHCSMVLYQDWHRSGAEIEIIDGQAGFVSLGGRGSNNQASSAGVFCAR